MIDFSRRSRQPERIDFPERLSAAEMEATLRELRLVNRWLGGTRAILGPLKKSLGRLSERRGGNPVRVLDLGCGAADIPIELTRWARRRSIAIQVVALDFNHKACRVARDATAPYPEIHVVRADVFHPCFAPDAFDVALFSAFLHHFPDQDIVRILERCGESVGELLLINDLQRSRWAYLGIRLLTALFSRSAAVRNDGPLSVLKGFRRQDLRNILSEAGFPNAPIRWRWAFRWSAALEIAHRGP